MSAASDFIAARIKVKPRVAVVLGSGLGAFSDSIGDRTEMHYSEIPGWPRSTALGHAGKLVMGKVDGVHVAVLSGRAHLYEGYTPEQSVSAIHTLRLLPVESLRLTS